MKPLPCRRRDPHAGHRWNDRGAQAWCAGVLSPMHHRERQVLQGAANGLTNERIAAELNLGAETIKTYKRRLLANLGAANTAHAVALGFRAGLIE